MSKQNSTNYKPTEKEKALLEILINPDYRMKSITDICKAAKCTRNIYYDAFAKPGFVEIYKKYSNDLVKQSVASVLNTFIREAQRGSFQHGKVILEMAGMYNDKLEITGQINDPFKGLTTEELKKLIDDD